MLPRGHLVMAGDSFGCYSGASSGKMPRMLPGTLRSHHSAIIWPQMSECPKRRTLVLAFMKVGNGCWPDVLVIHP